MFADLPQSIHEFMQYSWSQIEPFYQDLERRPLNEATLTAWMQDWSELGRLVHEMHRRLWVATTQDTADVERERRYTTFLDEIYPHTQEAGQALKLKLLASRLQPAGFEIPLRNLRAQADLFRTKNLPLLSEEQKMVTEYDRIVGAQTVEWEGREATLQQLQPIYQEPDRSRRERAWLLESGRWLTDREAIGDLWARQLQVRGQLAENAGLPGFRAFRWRQLLRFDYSPEDCDRFHQAIGAVVVPAARRVYEKRRSRLGLQTLRPWDLFADPYNRPPLRPFETVQELEEKTGCIFHKVDPQLGNYFETMRREGLLDLENRKGKAPGGYCDDFKATRRPFIFMNAVGIHDDVLTLLHEGGHAFHHFEKAHLPYYYQFEAPMEFNEVASMSMELLGSPHLAAGAEGFYSQADAARARIEHLESWLLFWPYMAVVDAFQHWAYENLQTACDPVKCDAKWDGLWEQFMPLVDWSGLEAERATGWQRKAHIHEDPFYYIEYGLAQLGALQVWANALKDQSGAVASYRKALSLGNTVTLPELYAAAGARFAFDAGTLASAVRLAEETIAGLEQLSTTS
jgi:oligoendopeptidase F